MFQVIVSLVLRAAVASAPAATSTSAATSFFSGSALASSTTSRASSLEKVPLSACFLGIIFVPVSPILGIGHDNRVNLCDGAGLLLGVLIRAVIVFDVRVFLRPHVCVELLAVLVNVVKVVIEFVVVVFRATKTRTGTASANHDGDVRRIARSLQGSGRKFSRQKLATWGYERSVQKNRPRLHQSIRPHDRFAHLEGPVRELMGPDNRIAVNDAALLELLELMLEDELGVDERVASHC